jgi:hypothetical protein
MSENFDFIYFWIGALCGVAALATIVVGVLYFRRKRESLSVKEVARIFNVPTQMLLRRGKAVGITCAPGMPAGKPPLSFGLNAEDAISKLGAAARAMSQLSDACIPITKDAHWLKYRLVAAEEAQDFELCAVIKKRLDELKGKP